MKACFAFALCLCLFTALSAADECEYTMKKMCDLVENATYNERGCWYTCRIKAEFEVFSGTKLNGTPCKSILSGVEGVCVQGLCYPKQ